jgi:DNA polymerase family A
MINRYREIVLVDFEFRPRDGEQLEEIVCVVVHQLKSGTTLRLWQDQLGPVPPYPTGADVLFVAYNTVAEVSCHLALGWPAPQRMLDLYTEYLAHINAFRPKGTEPPGAKLIHALANFGLDTIGAEEKKEMIALILRGGPWTAEERLAILDYCESDVLALKRLLPALLPIIDLPRALLRGRYMCAVAAMERNGIPIDGESLARLHQCWQSVQQRLISEDDVAGVYDAEGSFSAARFADLLIQHDIAWPCYADGTLDLRKETFRDMADTPGASAIAPLCRLRNGLSGLRLGIGLVVGSDNRNRTTLFPFRSTTGRNQPSNAKYIFGCARWLRGLIKPPPGYAIAYLDWKQQEFGIAAALSGDEAMIIAYQSGDPYLAFAKQAGAVPADATQKTHGTQRDLFKQCVLATQYGQGAKSLALRIIRPGINEPVEQLARDLLGAHRRTFRKFWDWNETFIDTATWRRSARTVFGWPARVGENPNPRSIANFPMQANGAEMLRVACCLAVERGVEVCAPVHDAVMICAPTDRINEDATKMQAAMAEASRIVLDGFELGTDVKVIRYPDRYMDERKGSLEMWDRIWGLVNGEERKAA